MKNYLMSSLAIVGAVSLIIMACSADNANNTNSTASTNAVGKYQISSYSTLTATGDAYVKRYFDVINTETGEVKSYCKTATSSNYLLINTTVTQ